jgi:protein-tyrosine-phosphatase
MSALLVLCTGNAARSVMAGFMLETLDVARGGTDLHIVTGGTHTVDGQPMGQRTRSALKALPELANLEFGRHRSRQVGKADLDRADLVVVMEADHVRFVRRLGIMAADRTATIRRLCEDLPPGPPSLGERVATLALADAMLSDADDVIDPAGGEAAEYEACVTELWALCQGLITLL